MAAKVPILLLTVTKAPPEMLKSSPEATFSALEAFGHHHPLSPFPSPKAPFSEAQGAPFAAHFTQFAIELTINKWIFRAISSESDA